MKLVSQLAVAIACHIPRGYWRIVRFAAKRDQSLWDLPIPLRFLPSETIRADLRESVFMPFLRYGCFPSQIGEDLLCKRILRSGDLIFDVGANIGYPSILYSSLVGPTGKIIALEPSPRAFRLLERAVSNRGNIECLNMAASDKDGVSVFYETENLVLSSVVAVSGIDPCMIRTITLDRLAKTAGNPDFVKIDVEGFEPMVLEGMAELFGGDFLPIVLFEALDDNALTQSLEKLYVLAHNQYSVFRIGPDGTARDLKDPSGSINYLAVPNWRQDWFRSLIAVWPS